MVAIARSDASSAAKPTLDAYVTIGGVLAAPYSLAFQVFDISTDDKWLAPVQVFPASAGQKQAVNLTNDAVAVGHYAAAWSVGSGEALGRHEVRWFAVLNQGDAEIAWSRRFEVLPVGAQPITKGYLLAVDMRDEGVPVAITDARIWRAILSQSAFIDRCTRQWFEPRAAVYRLDGSNSRTLRFGVPIVGVNSIKYDADGNNLDLANNLSVYNRHLRDRLLDPDDRNDPRIEWKSSSRPWYKRTTSEAITQFWEPNRQNVVVNGIFGYTDPDGSFTGDTPEMIRQACKLLVLRELPKLYSEAEEAFEAKNRNNIVNEQTRDQRYQLGSGVSANTQGVSPWTGDAEIDGILASFQAPIAVRGTS